MSLKNFIKENMALTAGIVLPVVLVVLFMVASMVPRMTVEPPVHELVFSLRKYDDSPDLKFNVKYFIKNGVLQAEVTKTDAKRPGRMDALYIYDPKNKTLNDITPDFKTAGTFPVNETKDAKVDKSNISPDGYEFESAKHYGGSPLYIFGGGREARTPAINKKGNRIKLPDDANIAYYNTKFIGWVIRKDVK